YNNSRGRAAAAVYRALYFFAGLLCGCLRCILYIDGNNVSAPAGIFAKAEFNIVAVGFGEGYLCFGIYIGALKIGLLSAREAQMSKQYFAYRIVACGEVKAHLPCTFRYFKEYSRGSFFRSYIGKLRA